MKKRPVSRPVVLLTLLAPLLLAGCGSGSAIRGVSDDEYQDYRTKGGEQGKLGGDQGLVFGVGKGSNSDASQAGAALGVNAYLWRGALDTLSFMPLASADPFGGVIITDWYEPPAGQGERFKATAYILGRQLRADGIKVSIFRQVNTNGRWVDAAVSPVTTADIENKVLARARELRSQTAAQ
jgi:hypothetical protein